MAITVVAVTLYLWFARKTYRFATITGSGPRRVGLRLGNWKPVAVLVCVAIVFLEFLLPFFAIILVSTTNIYVTGSLSFIWNFPSSYVTASQVPFFYQSLTATIEIGITAAAVSATAIGAVISYASLRSTARAARLVEYVSSVP